MRAYRAQYGSRREVSGPTAGFSVVQEERYEGYTWSGYGPGREV